MVTIGPWLVARTPVPFADDWVGGGLWIDHRRDQVLPRNRSREAGQARRIRMSP
jgi:hypothetical protein